MRVQISAIGTARNAPEDDMIRSYLKRLESARTIGGDGGGGSGGVGLRAVRER